MDEEANGDARGEDYLYDVIDAFELLPEAEIPFEISFIGDAALKDVMIGTTLQELQAKKIQPEVLMYRPLYLQTGEFKIGGFVRKMNLIDEYVYIFNAVLKRDVVTTVESSKYMYHYINMVGDPITVKIFTGGRREIDLIYVGMEGRLLREPVTPKPRKKRGGSRRKRRQRRRTTGVCQS
jgi:hypothetical protein